MKEKDEIVFIDGYLKIAEEEGFRIVLTIPFVGDEDAKENFYILWHKEYGALLVFNTSEGRVNKGILYYNLKFRGYSEHLGSGEYYRTEEDEGVWIGYCDCREGLMLRSRLEILRDHGQFVTPWVKQPFLWLLHYMDEKATDYDYKAINKARIAQLPEEIQKAICP